MNCSFRRKKAQWKQKHFDIIVKVGCSLKLLACDWMTVDRVSGTECRDWQLHNSRRQVCHLCQ